MSCSHHRIGDGFIFSKLAGRVTIEECYEQYFEELVQSVECIVHHHDLSEDIVQNLFLELLQSCSTRNVTDYRHLKRYFHLAARRRAYDWLRSNKRKQAIPLYEILDKQEHFGDPAERILLKEDLQIITAFIAKQKDRNRRIFLLRVEGISVRRLARKFKIAPATVYAILSKIRRNLTDLVDKKEKIR